MTELNRVSPKSLSTRDKPGKTIKYSAYRLGFENLAVALINGVAALTGLSHNNRYKRMHGRLISPEQGKATAIMR